VLVLTRKLDERIHIGDDVVITVCEIGDRKVRIGIEAPRSIEVWRSEIYERREFERAAHAGDHSIEVGGGRS
jgi:carbon storage regulator